MEAGTEHQLVCEQDRDVTNLAAQDRQAIFKVLTPIRIHLSRQFYQHGLCEGPSVRSDRRDRIEYRMIERIIRKGLA